MRGPAGQAKIANFTNSIRTSDLNGACGSGRIREHICFFLCRSGWLAGKARDRRKTSWVGIRTVVSHQIRGEWVERIKASKDNGESE